MRGPGVYSILMTGPTRREICAALLAASTGAAGTAREPQVEVEDLVYEYTPADNGAGPLWDYGAPGIVRLGDTVFVPGLDTIPGARPLHNCRWALHRRDARGWQRVFTDENGRQREPCPIGIFPDGRLLVSVNPTLTPPGAYNGPADPHLLEFSARNLRQPPRPVRPAWSGEPRLTEHTYRGLGIDAARGAALALHNDGSGAPRAHWVYLDREGDSRQSGAIVYPIRGCYPQIALRAPAAHVLAVGDIVEPVVEWRKWKFEQTGRQWDYVFRRLYYVLNPAAASGPFTEPVEVANLDATAGHILNLDLWLAPDGAAHLLWLERSVQSKAMRERFFPKVPLTASLMHCVVRDGRPGPKRTLAAGGEDTPGPAPAYARFHAAPDGRLFVLASFRKGEDIEMRLLQPESGQPAVLSLRHPFTNFMTATERGGSRPSNLIDVTGIAAGAPNAIRYARLRI